MSACVIDCTCGRHRVGRCADGCTCNRHKPDTPERAAMRREVMIGKNVGKKYGPHPPERIEIYRQKSMGNQHALGHRDTPAQRAVKGQRSRERWLAGVYDHKHPCWGIGGTHAGIKMRCLNSEGVFARDLDRAGIAWRYEPKRFKLSWCSYKPDFYLPDFDIWIEVKGYPEMPGTWKEKVATFRKETGKCLVVVFMKELSTINYGGESDG